MMAADEPPIPPAPNLEPMVFLPSGESGPAGPEPPPSESATSPATEDVAVVPGASVVGVAAPPPPGAPPFSPMRLLSALIAWMVILFAVVFVVVGRPILQAVVERLGWVQHHGAGEDGADADLRLVIMRMQARYLVGASDLMNMKGELYKQAKMLNEGTDLQRLSFVILAGELEGPGEALQRLAEIPPFQEAELVGILRRLYSDYARGLFNAPDVTEEQRGLLVQRLGWLGRLALAPPSAPSAVREPVLAPARRTAIVLIVVFVLIILAALAGFVLMLLFGALTIAGVLKSHSAPIGSGTGHVYAETFAVWIVLYLILSIIAGLLPVGRFFLLASGIAMLLSLSALTWPVLRGVPWAQVRREIGLTRGKGVLLEPLFGPVCYAAALPMVGVGLLFTLLLARLLGGSLPGLGMAANEPMAHPLVGWLAEGGWPVWLQAIFVAAVVAPIAEEIMFRGVLYRHLREATGGAGRWLSVLGSAFAVSFVFAVIHPQGVAAVPVLMALAFGFTLTREWRGTLLPSMVAHSLNNACVTLLVILMVA
jgi:membrane protease YdiL (CAAX protease family)